MTRPGYHGTFDLSGEIPFDSMETLAYNVMELIELDRQRSGCRTAPPTPVGALDYIQKAVVYLAQLRRIMKNEQAEDH